jgi:hypothetical protein
VHGFPVALTSFIGRAGAVREVARLRGKRVPVTTDPASPRCALPPPSGSRTAPSRLVHGSRAVAGQVLGFARFARFARPVLVNGTPGLIAAPDGQPISVMGVTFRATRSSGSTSSQTPNASAGWI